LPAIPFLIILSAFTIRELAGKFAVYSKQIFVVLGILQNFSVLCKTDKLTTAILLPYGKKK
jgi:hypothetical protein